MKNKEGLMLSLFPNMRGFGYVCLEWPQRIVERGVFSPRPKGNVKILRQVTKYVEFFKPMVIILRDCDTTSGSSMKQTKKLVTEITEYAKGVKVPVYRYSREQVRDVFEQFGASTKYEIANKIVTWFPELARLAPPIRKPWKDEDYHMGVFDAMALIITHKYLTE